MPAPRRTLRIAVLVGIAGGLALLVGLGVRSGVIIARDLPFAVCVALAIVAVASIPLWTD